MQCPKCAIDNVKVIDSRPFRECAIRRRRICLSCDHRFTTYEYNTMAEANKEAFKRGYNKALEKVKHNIREIFKFQAED